MGFYGSYLEQDLASNFQLLTQERQAQLKKISELRGGRDVLVFAADINTEDSRISIGYMDHLPISDQLSNLTGEKLDLILETPGGSGESAEEIVRILRDRYSDVAVIIPGWAKSAGTLMAMAADEILMGPTSALGPIDAQLIWQGKRFSAQALLDGVDKIKEEVLRTSVLNKAYIPVLQGISPGELENARNALEFAKALVRRWLADFKFQNWTTHSSTGEPVTETDRANRANEIAEQLCNHGRWLTHGRSIRLQDLVEMRLQITDYSQSPDLLEAITRYYTLLQMSFSSNMYKLYETPGSQIYKFLSPTAPPPAGGQILGSAEINFECSNCKHKSNIQANFVPNAPTKPGYIRYPMDNKLRCPQCKTEHDLSGIRRQLEAQAKRPLV